MNSYMLFALLMLILNCNAFSQQIKGFTKNKKNEHPISYVNIGVPGKNQGTVSDANGAFIMYLDSLEASDTIRISRIGFHSRSMTIKKFHKFAKQSILLEEKIHNLKEITVHPQEYKLKNLGFTRKKLSSAGFEEGNLLGYEMGVLFKVRKTAILKRVHFLASICSYDSVFYRLNIYKHLDDNNFKNILHEPLYINLSKEELKNTITIDLSKQSLIVDGDFMVSLEVVKDLGPGELMLYCSMLKGIWYRSTSQGYWRHNSVGGLSISVDALIEK